MSDSQISEFEGHDGVRIAYRARRVPTPIGSLLFIHGLGDHSGWFEPLGAAANARGIDWYGLDLRGHGWSAGKRGHADSFDDLLRDVDELRSRVADSGAGAPGERPIASVGSPIVLGGHSLGGLVALRYAQEHSSGLAGLLLVAPFLAVAARVPDWKRILARVANRVVPRLSLDNGLVSADLISDVEALAAHEIDPLTHHRISARLWAESLVAHGLARHQAPLPTLFQLAGDDRAVQTTVAQRLCAAWQHSSRCVVYPGALHDLYHDRVARQALTDAVDWVATVCDQSSGGRSPTDRGNQRSEPGGHDRSEMI